MEREQITAIKYAELAAPSITRELPQIAEDYRAGDTLPAIVQKYDIRDRFNFVSDMTAARSVRLALIEILGKEQVFDLGKKHREDCGKNQYNGGKGCHSLSIDEKRKICQSIGRINYSKGKACFGLDDGGKKQAIDKSLATRGLTPWSDEEIMYAFALSRLDRYRTNAGTEASRERISRKVSEQFRPRSVPSVASVLKNKDPVRYGMVLDYNDLM